LEISSWLKEENLAAVETKCHPALGLISDPPTVVITAKGLNFGLSKLGDKIKVIFSVLKEDGFKLTDSYISSFQNLQECDKLCRG
jgi:hypothetical protein